MAVAKIVKPNQVRGSIFDKLAECFGDSVLGMYDKKLRVEIIDDATGEVIQFSLAPVIHKDLVDEEDCDKLVPIEDQMAEYEKAMAEKTAANEAKKAKKDSSKTKKTSKKKEDKDKDVDAPVETTAPVVQIQSTELTEEEQTKLDELNAMLAGGSF